MDPDLTSDQLLLRETTERFIEETLPLSRVREMAESNEEPDPSYWSKGADLGWFAFLAPEELGGGSISGNGLLDAVILAEVRGTHLQPGPFIDTNVVIASLATHGSEDQRAKVVPSLVSGEVSAVWAMASATGDWSGKGGVECKRSATGFRLNGHKALVVEAQGADWVLVTTECHGDGPIQFLVPTRTPGLSVVPRDGLDLTRRLCEIHFEDVDLDEASIVGTTESAASTIDSQMQLAALLSVAECIGAMDYLFNLALTYSKDRIAFGRPIGSFQAVKHQLADTSLSLEMSKAAATAASQAVQHGAANSSEVASIAKAFVSQAAVDLAHNCWQIFGGIAYTWEHDFHLYLRRLTVDASLYGPPAWHRERICQLAAV